MGWRRQLGGAPYVLAACVPQKCSSPEPKPCMPFLLLQEMVIGLCICMQVTRLVEGAYAAGRVIAAVCHGPVALLEAKDADGRPLVAGKQARVMM